ncbi:hypothetical protein [uncultured Tenacibaculum sp.]|uniref:hypothetical protein n=1 Tax=uncultured Tenacibaculum sp. TaxID=174713 RepID=UPI00260AB99A|nr:hypothetical protein [uncultured Tenacibaculum sp.]
MYATKFNEDSNPWVTNDFINFSDYFLRNNDYLPPLCIQEIDEYYLVKLIFSGPCCKWMFRVYWEDDLLVICGQRQNNSEEQPKQIKTIQAFKRIIIIPSGIKIEDKIDFEFKNCNLIFKLFKECLMNNGT